MRFINESNRRINQQPTDGNSKYKNIGIIYEGDAKDRNASRSLCTK